MLVSVRAESSQYPHVQRNDCVYSLVRAELSKSM